MWTRLPSVPLHCPALLCLALPCPALPCPALPCPALPCHSLPCLPACRPACLPAGQPACLPACPLACPTYYPPIPHPSIHPFTHLTHPPTHHRQFTHQATHPPIYASTPRVVSLRRRDKVEIVGAETLLVERKGPRTCVRAKFRKTGASTPGQTEGHFIVTLNHTRSGSSKSGMRITANNPVRFKQDRAR